MSNTNRPVQLQKITGTLKFRKKRNCTIRVAKTKSLISCAVTAQLICTFVVFARCSFNTSDENRFIGFYGII